MDSALAIEVSGLARTFGSIRAVDGVAVAVRQGEIVSLLGPNGAGKSTVISTLSGLPRPTAGEASVMGHSVTREPMAVKSLLGVVRQDVAFYPDLTARDNLTF